MTISLSFKTDVQWNVNSQKKFMVNGFNPRVQLFVWRDRPVESSLERLLLVTDVSTTWALVIFSS